MCVAAADTRCASVVVLTRTASHPSHDGLCRGDPPLAGRIARAVAAKGPVISTSLHGGTSSADDIGALPTERMLKCPRLPACPSRKQTLGITDPAVGQNFVGALPPTCVRSVARLPFDADAHAVETKFDLLTRAGAAGRRTCASPPSSGSAVRSPALHAKWKGRVDTPCWRSSAPKAGEISTHQSLIASRVDPSSRRKIPGPKSVGEIVS